MYNDADEWQAADYDDNTRVSLLKYKLISVGGSHVFFCLCILVIVFY